MERMKRPTKIQQYLKVAQVTSERSTCLKERYGAVIVTDDEVVSTGYNGSPRGMTNCIDRGICPRVKYNVPRGTNYHYCYSIHAEMNAIISAGRKLARHGALYLFGFDVINNRIVKSPGVCIMCKRAIINAGLEEIVYADPDGIDFNPETGFGHRIEKIADWVRQDAELPAFGSGELLG